MKEVLGKVILAAVLMIMGAVLIGVIADNTIDKTTKNLVQAEQIALDLKGYPHINTTKVYTVTNAPDDWKVADCPLTNFAIKNASGTAITLTTDYTVTLSAGTFKLLDTTATNTTNNFYGDNNKTYVDYEYCADDYMNSSWGRSIMNLIAGFLALVLFGAAVGVMYSIYKDVK